MPQLWNLPVFTQKIVCFLIIFSISFIISPKIEARNGFIPHYVGAHGITGGAGLAYPHEASNVVTNPAAIGMLPTHVLLMAGVLFQDQFVDASKSQAGNPRGKLKNLHDNTLIASLGANYRWNERWATGVGVSGGGGETKLQDSITNPAFLNPAKGGFDREVVNNVILTVPSIAYSPTPRHSYGIGLLVGYSRFRGNLAKAGFVQIKGRNRADTAYGLGMRFGLLFKLTDYLSFGSSISTPVYFQKHKKYDDLLKERMEIPATFLAGIALKLTESLDFLFDYKEIFYGYSAWLRRGEGWRNQTVLLAGLQYHVNEKLVVGFGYNYGASPINKGFVTLNATSLPLEEHNLSGGFRYKLTPTKEFILVVFYTPPFKMTDDGTKFANGAFAGTKIVMNKTYGFETGFKFDL